PNKAVILVGGPGTRLRPLTDDRPKSVVPVLNYPAIEHTFAYLKKYGVTEIILAVNYLPDVIEKCFGDGSRCGIKLIYNMEKEPLGTAGAVKNAARYIDGTFFVFNGDLFTDLNLAEMFNFHRKSKAKATISLTWVDDPSRFGVVETDKNQKVKAFIEKPPLAEATTHWINAGTYVLEPEVLDHIPGNQHYMFENGLYPSLLKAGEPVYGFPYRGFWLDMGTPATYFSINSDLLTSKVASPLVAPLTQGKDGVRCGEDVVIHPSAKLNSPVIIGGGCRIGAGARITGPVVMGPGCSIEDGAVVENSILWDNVTVRTNRVLSHCIACSCTVIQEKTNDLIITQKKTTPLPR
ncbi:MAG TPA: NDP-sugar synthase, partial [Dehalococcoidales bacterium]|nr:NDP-sugar synthase [Dehalococcoidales bacterium]